MISSIIFWELNNLNLVAFTHGVLVTSNMAPIKEKMWSVSYTHLDVYKRQYIHTVLIQEIKKRRNSGTCSYKLEYTLEYNNKQQLDPRWKA